MKPLFVIDLDGTIADNTHREFLIQGPNPDWDAFHSLELMNRDKPIEVAQAHFEGGRFKYGDHIFLTGRTLPRDNFILLYPWLGRHGFMPPGNEHHRVTVTGKPMTIRTQRSRIFKVDALRSWAKYQYRTRKLICIDNHEPNLAAMSEAGFTTVKAPECWSFSPEQWKELI